VKVIAIDGPAGSGKSTVARRLAARLGLDYLDTGAMYRAVTFAALRRGIDPAEAGPVADLARTVELEVAADSVRVDEVDATIEIRGPEVSRAVSLVAANPDVRTELVRRQREWATERGGGVLEGRDIGTVGFPDAVLKVYLTARPEVRAERRAAEVTDLDYETVAADMARRDALDQGRASDPLRLADGALEVDTSDLGVDEIVERLAGMVDDDAAGPAPDAPSGEPATGAAGSPPGDPVLAKTDELRAPAVQVHPPTSLERVSYGLIRGAFFGLAKAYFRLEIHGAENVPAHGPFVLAPVHRSNLDFILVSTVRRPRMRYMGKASIWKSKALGRFVSMLGAFPVHRGTADRESLRTCLEVIENGEPIVMFPEGTRREGPTVDDLFDGPAYVAARAGVPLVPVGIGGSDIAMPVGARFIKPRKIVLVVGEPIEPPVGDGTGRVKRRVVREMTASLQTEVQRLYDAAQRLAGAS
jgi:cytidylate kinase